MNKDRRNRLADVFSTLETCTDALDAIMQEEQDAFDNLPEAIQSGEKGSEMESIISDIEEAYNSIEEAKETLSTLL